jgi:hypothetical protein
MSKLLDYDNFSGVVKTYHKDPVTGLITISSKQEVGDILDINQKQRSESGTGWRGDMHHVASIPINIINLWRNELKAQGKNPNPLATENRPWLMARLNNSEFKKLRTKEGRI